MNRQKNKCIDRHLQESRLNGRVLKKLLNMIGSVVGDANAFQLVCVVKVCV